MRFTTAHHAPLSWSAAVRQMSSDEAGGSHDPLANPKRMDRALAQAVADEAADVAAASRQHRENGLPQQSAVGDRRRTLEAAQLLEQQQEEEAEDNVTSETGELDGFKGAKVWPTGERMPAANSDGFVITAVDPFYLRIPDLQDIGSGQQDSLLIRVSTDVQGVTGWGESDSAPLVGLTAYITPRSHTCIRSIQESLVGEVVNGTDDIERLQQKVLSADALDVQQVRIAVHNGPRYP
jgi:hypothetical protein